MLRPKYILKPQHLPYWRRHPDLNWGIKVLQTSALPLGYGAISRLRLGKRCSLCLLLGMQLKCYGLRHWSGLRGSNPPPRPWQGRALPNELNPQVAAPYFDTGWCLRSELNQRHGDFQSPALPTELQRRKQEHMPLFKKDGDPDGARTHDLQRDRLAF